MNQRTKLASALLAFALVFSLTAWSQETHPSKSNSGQSAQDLPAYNSAQKLAAEANKQNPERYFKLTFRVLDVSPDGKVAGSRSYIQTVATGANSSSIRTKDSVPVIDSMGGAIRSSHSIDIGTQIDTKEAEVIGQKLCLTVLASISSVSTTAPGSSQYPVVRRTDWRSRVIVPIGKPTLIFSSDNNADKGKTELELTAVPIGQ